MNKKIEKRYVLKKSVRRYLNKILLVIIIFLVTMINIKLNPNLKKQLKSKVYEESFSFQKFRGVYKKYLGDILTVKTETVKPVFNEKLSYKSIKEYKEGVLLEVEEGYQVPFLNSGVVVFLGEKEGLGNTIIVEQIDGISVIYSNVITKDIKLYDYVEKRKYLGTVKDKKLILFFQKEGKYLNYKDYL